MNYLFHHNDMDGFASAAIIKYFMKKAEMPIDYYSMIDYNKHRVSMKELAESICRIENMDLTDELEEKFFNELETVFIVDYAFTEKTIDKLLDFADRGIYVVWIDHHLSSMDFFDGEVFTLPDNLPFTPKNDIEYYRNYIYNYIDIQYCGAYNAWIVEADKPVPDFIKIVDSWDTFKFNMDNTLELKYYIDSMYPNNAITSFETLIDKYLSEEYDHTVILNEYISKGRPIKNFMDKQYSLKRYRCYEIDDISHQGLKAIALNGDDYTSLVFGDYLKDYDYGVVYSYNGNYNNYRCSIYSAKDNVNCNEIAKLYGGGGHKGAAGFVVEKLPPELVK